MERLYEFDVLEFFTYMFEPLHVKPYRRCECNQFERNTPTVMTYTLSRDYIPLTLITYQAFSLDKNKTVQRLSYFLARLRGFEPPFFRIGICCVIQLRHRREYIIYDTL